MYPNINDDVAVFFTVVSMDCVSRGNCFLITASSTPLHRAMTRGGISSFQNSGDLFETCRLLVDAGADEVLIDNMEFITEFNGSLLAFKYLQRQTYPPFHSMPAASRLALATEYLVNIEGGTIALC
ncbi:uncharacterized protein LY89DRAFT_97073 [Mollisia scopiformis]|uniref:Uncharacterized protein n=1 Tax=Mollisia scopiformis TaxID=149040 RepID=A0A194X6L9_MOLSC|nr:uncharacterized protein LY89DRAFT_97073 [Mollisia scopiformis]KUJ15825.1 hypothetical protein LY89DRAFT_97073 [Mollisia scopiformis]